MQQQQVQQQQQQQQGAHWHTPHSKHGTICFSLELQETTRVSVAATMFFCFCSAAAMAPQYIKIYIRQSSDGVSFVALALATLGYSLQVDNLFVLHFDQIKECFCVNHCRIEPIIACDHSLTTFAYMIVAFLISLPLMPFAATYHPDKRTREGAMLGFTVLCVGMTMTRVPLVWLLLPGGNCAELAGYGIFLGISAGVCYAVMYIPQIVESARVRGAMALSYVSLSLHVVVGVAAAVQKAKGTKERMVTWVPPLVANAFQLVLLAMNLYFDLVERRSAAEAAQGGATEGGTSRDTRGARKAAAGFGSVDSAKGALLEAGEGDAGGDSSKQRREKQEPGFPSLEWWKKYL